MLLLPLTTPLSILPLQRDIAPSTVSEALFERRRGSGVALREVHSSLVLAACPLGLPASVSNTHQCCVTIQKASASHAVGRCGWEREAVGGTHARDPDGGLCTTCGECRNTAATGSMEALLRTA